jgi:Xaa-Pro aminopeptidase
MSSIIEEALMDLKGIQAALKAAKVDGWLLCDFRNRDYLAYRVLGMDVQKLNTRLVLLPRQGRAPARERRRAPCSTRCPAESRHRLAELRGAEEASPEEDDRHRHWRGTTSAHLRRRGHDGAHQGQGTRSPSADLVQLFVSVIDEAGYRLHKDAGVIMDRIRGEAFEEIRKAIRMGSGATEYDVQQYIMRRFAEHNLTTYSPPMVGVNDHPADPHFEVTAGNAREFKPGDTVLIDLWAKKDVPGGIYYDITWCGYIGDKPPAKYKEIFNVVCCARDAAIAFVQENVAKGRDIGGWQVDDVCRNAIRKTGYGSSSCTARPRDRDRDAR